NKTRPIAIVGISCLFPKADGLQAYWANIKNGVDAITPVPAATHWNAAEYFDADPKSPDRTYAQSGGFLSPLNFNPMDFGIAPKDIEATDTSQLLSLVAAQRALADAGYATGNGPGRKFDRERTSVILGVTGALELVIPLGARLGHPIWRRASRIPTSAGRKIPSPGCSAMSPPAASPTALTWAAPIASSTRLARARSPRSTSPASSWPRAARTW